MTEKTIRVLFIADTHLGFDLPFKPRVNRRRRGHDFFANYEKALQLAVDESIDLVVHGGDLLFRTRVPPALVDQALAPLVDVAERGIPVYLVPGNHERSRIPMQLWSYHPNLHIFDRPRTYSLDIRGTMLALAGFPFARKVRDAFQELYDATGLPETQAGVKLLCIHQAVEGAQVGPSDYTFRHGPDVISGKSIPGGLDAILSGHIHRAQVLTQDLSGRKLNAPVFYPGSIERTSFAERFEEKGCLILEINLLDQKKSTRITHTFIPLPVRPMVNLHLNPEHAEDVYLNKYLEREFNQLDPDSIVRIHLDEGIDPSITSMITSARLRQIAPESMNISLGNTWSRSQNSETNP